ncbi:MAG: VOC family protein [Alphaproteobacteria bacterium]|nr:VOC family protein [Alphaproteobacteria bacterium]
MAHGLPGGSPLSVATISVSDMNRSLDFYCRRIGMTVRSDATWSGPAFARHWHLAGNASARAVFLAAATHAVGRVLLLQFDATGRAPIRQDAVRRGYGLWNLNFYTHDIVGASKELAGLGYRFWSEPTAHNFSPEVGSPVEVMFDGPDEVPINLVELRGGGPGSQIGGMRTFLQQHGTTKTGFTPVVTSSHCVRSREKGIAFYRDVLGMHVVIDEEMNSPAANHFLNIPASSRTHVTFVEGNHMFGKVAMSWPVNYTPVDLVPRAIAPNVGYLSQTFLVPDVAATIAATQEQGGQVYTPRHDVDIPGLGAVTAAIVRNPASGALTEFVETKA